MGLMSVGLLTTSTKKVELIRAKTLDNSGGGAKILLELYKDGALVDSAQHTFLQGTKTFHWVSLAYSTFVIQHWNLVLLPEVAKETVYKGSKTSVSFPPLVYHPEQNAASDNWSYETWIDFVYVRNGDKITLSTLSNSLTATSWTS